MKKSKVSVTVLLLEIGRKLLSEKGVRSTKMTMRMRYTENLKT